MTSAPIAETSRSHPVLARCSATPDVSRSSASPDDAREEHIGFVGQGLALVGAKNGQDLLRRADLA